MIVRDKDTVLYKQIALVSLNQLPKLHLFIILYICVCVAMGLKTSTICQILVNFISHSWIFEKWSGGWWLDLSLVQMMLQSGRLSVSITPVVWANDWDGSSSLCHWRDAGWNFSQLVTVISFKLAMGILSLKMELSGWRLAWRLR